MNEKIKELADEAGINYQFAMGASADSVTDLQLEEFAELIVQECIDICKSHKIQSTDAVWYLAHNETVNNISENIEKYFGVE